MARRGDGVYLRGESWYLGCSISGIRYQRRLGRLITRKTACELAQVQRAAILRGEAGIGRKRKDLSFDAARKEFQKWADGNKKAGTAGHYEDCLRQLARSFSGKRLSQISSFAVESYKQGRVTAGAKVAVNRELSVLKSLFNRCKGWKLFEGDNPVLSVKMRKEPRQRLRFLEHEEEDRLLAACAEPLRSLILVGTNCGLRLTSEALTLRWADVDVARKTLTVAAAYAKSGTSRTVSLNSVVLAALTQLPKRSDFVFTKPNGKPFRKIPGFRAACRRAGLTDDVTGHTTRHTFATRLVENGVDLRTVQELGGWSDLALVQRYTHVSPSRKEQAVEGLVRHSTPGLHTLEIRHIGNTA